MIGMIPGTHRILIADNHQIARQRMRDLLDAMPAWQVVAEASDGRAAFRLAIEVKPDIAVLDYSLPEMNGLELTRAIKRALPHVEILIYTMNERESVLADILRAGARGYVLKSDSEANLIAAVEALSMHKPYFSGAISDTLLGHFVEGDREVEREVVLTPRQREIVQLIAEGKINKQVAYTLDISVKTVETHRAAAMHKLKLRTTAELVLYAVRNNIVEP